MSTSRIRAYIYLLIVVVIWGIAPSVIKFALGELPPFLFLTYRFFVSIIVLLPFFLMSKERKVDSRDWLFLIITSLLGSTVNLGLLFYGTNLTTSIDASLISATSPIMIIVASVIFLGDRITTREKMGIAITILGTVIITLQSFLEKGGAAGISILGNIVIFVSNIAYAAFLILSKKGLRKEISPLTLTFMMFLVGFITTIPLAFTEVAPSQILPAISKVSIYAHLSVIYMAVFSGAIAYFLYQRAQKTIEASEASLFNYLPPIVTAPIGAIWLHEQITIPYIIGSIVIAMGVFLAEWKRRKI